MQVSLNKAAEIPQAEAAPERQLDQKPIPSIPANKQHRLPNKERKIRTGRRLRTRYQLKAAAAQRVPPRLPVRRQTEPDLARQAKMGCDQRLRAFLRNSSSSHSGNERERSSDNDVKSGDAITSTHCDTYGNAERESHPYARHHSLSESESIDQVSCRCRLNQRFGRSRCSAARSRHPP